MSELQRVAYGSDEDPDAHDAMESGLPATGKPVLDQARRRFQRCAEWEATWRPLFISDIKFRHGDDDNGYQWPNSIRRSRDVAARPCLTMNMVRQHNLQIINERKKNKAEVSIIPTGGGATAESALMLSQVVRDIQYKSTAQLAYSIAQEFQVDGGIGYWRLATDWVGPKSFDQQILILPIPDPLSVYLDPAIKSPDGSDARFGFIFDDVPKEQFREAYPELGHLQTHDPLGTSSGDSDWLSKDHVRVCEYFRKELVKDTLYSFIDPSDGVRKTILESEMPREIARAVKDDPLTRTRLVWKPVVEWYLFVGEEQVDSTIWPGSYIPIIRVIGEETVINGILDRKGHTRAMKGAQRMYNYNASGQVEFVALQSKTPWTGAAEAIEEHESLWNTANTENHSFLPFNHLDSNGQPIPVQALPRRQDPPVASPAFEAGMTTAFNQIMMVSGQFQNQLGMMGNERTGEAISQRQAQSDTATFHFQDNFNTALVYTGRQIIELIAKVYDTERVLNLQADDGSTYELLVNPKAPQAAEIQRAVDGKIVKRIFNPSIGEYEVRSAVGQSFGSQREQTVQALTLILTQAPALTGVIGDLLLSALDFKEASEAAQRLRRMVPPQALGEGPSQTEQQQAQQIQQLQTALGQALQKLGREQLKVAGKDQMRDIDAYNAETDRFKALASAMMLDQGGIKKVVEELIRDAAQTHLAPILAANQEGIKEQSGNTLPAGAGAAAEPPVPGAQQAPDGEWYLADPTRRGKYMRVAPMVQERAPRNVIANG